MATDFEQDKREIEKDVSHETLQPQPAQDESILGGPVAMHHEATMLAFTALNDPYGVRWNLTIRHGARAQDVIDFSEVIAKAGQGLIGLGWKPVDSKAPVIWPPADKVEQRQKEIERAAQTMGAELAQEQLVPQAKSALLNGAIALGLVKDSKDAEGIEHMLAIGAENGLAIEGLPANFAKWVHALAAARTDEIKGEYAARAQSARQGSSSSAPPSPPSAAPPPPPSAAPPPPPSSAAPPPPPPSAAPPPNAPPQQAGGSFRCAKIKVAAKPDGAPKIEFYAQTGRWPEVTWYLGGEKLIEAFPQLVSMGWTAAHFVVGQEYPFDKMVHWEHSEKKSTSGRPYKNLTGIVP